MDRQSVVQGDGGQPGPSGRGRGSGRGSRGRGQPRQSRRAQAQAATATLNPMASDFSLLSVPDRLEQVRMWMRRFDLVRRRPQFRVILVETLIQAENGEPQILRIWFRGGFVLDGTFQMISRSLHARIVEAVDQSFEQDYVEQFFVFE